MGSDHLQAVLAQRREEGAVINPVLLLHQLMSFDSDGRKLL
ncbi:hypothetical protein CL3_16980 [butyrate-producing bacterium SM4/1]|nr:hypothetical protein CL3_16980 [butyrate-producing bacterium SM4/1]